MRTGSSFYVHYGIVYSPTHLNLYLLRNLDLISWRSPRLPRSSSSPHINLDTQGKQNPRNPSTDHLHPRHVPPRKPWAGKESPFTASMGRVPKVPHVCTMYDVRIRKSSVSRQLSGQEASESRPSWGAHGRWEGCWLVVSCAIRVGAKPLSRKVKFGFT